MSRIVATAGAKFFIGPAKVFDIRNFAESDFAPLAPSWVEIGGTTNLGSLGDTAELITSDQIGDPRTRKAKGVRNAGSMQVVCDIDRNDPGQLAAVAAEGSDETYAFKLQFNDAPSGGTPSIRYFVALVMSAVEQLDEANNVMKLNITLEIDSNIVRVAAAGAGSAPDNTVLPVITGTAKVGETLTASPGTWDGSPAPTYAYQWFGNGESLHGETGSTIDLVEDHEGLVVTVAVAATNVNGTATAISAATSAVASA